MIKKIIAIAAIASTFGMSAGAATIINGSFENPLSAPITTLGTGSSGLTGWAVEGSIDLIGNYWAASDGNQSLDMNGLFAAGAISQQIADLVIGATYTVLFDMAANAANAPTVKSLMVTAGNDSELFTFDSTGKSNSNMGWVTKSFQFIATDTTQVLRFASANDPNGAWGAALDNVRFAPVPLPAGAPLLLAGLAAFAVLRRRKRAV